ncbi:MAG: 6-phosphogluconolactonase [Burkholderiales bacterium]|nr:6-phosphogluconolactonase [Burkholderiales bacterium]
MRVERLPDAAAAAQWAAMFIAERARAALQERRRFLLALSGGRTPRPMFEALAQEALPWRHVELFQVDERVAPPASDARNWSHIEPALLAGADAPRAHAHPMPTDAPDLPAAAADYAQELVALAGAPPVLDLVHLGLGSDGHTASLFAGDGALDVDDAWVAVTGTHHGYRRMTLTLPTIDRARCILWLVCGADKAAMLARLVEGDERMPAGRVPRNHALVVADAAAAHSLGQR